MKKKINKFLHYAKTAKTKAKISCAVTAQLISTIVSMIPLLRGMAGKFVDTSAIKKSNALLKKRFA